MNKLIPTPNKQLQRQLKSTISNYKHQELKKFILRFKQELINVDYHQQFLKKGINCIQCNITLDQFHSTGYGRSQIQAQTNSLKNIIDTLISQNYCIEEIKMALKLNSSFKAINNQNKYEKSLNQSIIDQLRKNDQTLDLNPLQFSVIQQQGQLKISKISKDQNNIQKNSQGRCTCVYYDVHQHHKKQIANLQARIALLNNQNIVLKQMLLQKGEKNPKKAINENNQKENNMNLINTNSNLNDYKVKF